MSTIPFSLVTGQIALFSLPSWIIPTIAISGIAVVFGGLAYWGLRLEKKRSADIEAMMTPLGFAFTRDATSELDTILGHFRLGQRGGNRRLRNLLRATLDDGSEVIICESHFTEGGGVHSTQSIQAVLRITSSHFDLPEFHLVPDHIFHRIDHAFGARGTDLPLVPLFSKTYQLRGADEAALRMLFTPQIIAALEQGIGARRLTMEGKGNQVLMYQTGKQLRPGDFRSLLEDGMRVATLFGYEGDPGGASAF